MANNRFVGEACIPTEQSEHLLHTTEKHLTFISDLRLMGDNYMAWTIFTSIKFCWKKNPDVFSCCSAVYVYVE